MIIIKNGSLAFGAQKIFDELSFTISYDQKIGVLGRNGAGKSTLLKVLARHQSLDSGTISYDKKKTIAYLPQEEVINSSRTVFDEACSGFEHLIQKQARLLHIESLLTQGTDDVKDMLDEYHQLQEILEFFDKPLLEKKALEVLQGLGFSPEQINQPVHTLSVGWQMRVSLARLLLQNADFYLFDEPTNHLDLPAKEWFLDFVNNAPFGYLLVTHDRHYLEHGCSIILELERGKGKLYFGNFSYYLHEKEAEKSRIRDAYIQQQKEIERKKRTIERFRASASKARMAQSMEKALNKIELIEIEPEMPSINFSFPEPIRAGKIVLELNNIAYGFTDTPLFQHVNGQIKRGQKVALIAANGVGKTTLFNIIVGAIKPNVGTITFGHNVTYAYFEQEQSRVLNPNNTVLEEVYGSVSNVTEQTIRSFLGSFLFKHNDVYKKIKSLSGGERNRVAMVKVLLRQANFLILDEPTNHLDIYAKDILLQALKQYAGTVLLVSHDHDFIQQWADTIMELTPKELITFEGSYEGYLYYRKNIYQKENHKRGINTSIAKPTKHEKTPDTQRDMKLIERTISRLEHELEKMANKLGDVEYGSDEYIKIIKAYENTQKELQKNMQEWENLIS